jgi:hypothetical protein
MRVRCAAALAAAVLLACTAACRRREPRERAPAATPSAARTGPAPARADEAGYQLLAPEEAAVDAFLRENPDLRLASDEDRHLPEEENEVRDLYAVYHPYFVRGDANDDGRLDFVLGFVRRDSERDSPEFSVVVFAGTRAGGFSPGAFVERDVALADGDLSLDRDSIVVTPDLAEDIVRRYRWDAGRQRHVYVRDVPDEPVSPPPART